MRVEDVYVQGSRTWVRLHDKGGKRREMPCDHNLEAWLSEYIRPLASMARQGLARSDHGRANLERSPNAMASVKSTSPHWSSLGCGVFGCSMPQHTCLSEATRRALSRIRRENAASYDRLAKVAVERRVVGLRRNVRLWPESGHIAGFEFKLKG